MPDSRHPLPADLPKPVVLSQSVVFAGRVFRIERDELQLPDGPKTTLEIVRHRGSVVMIPQPSPTEIILIRQYRHAVGHAIWEVPAGTLEPGEDPDSAARRECAEEIGLAAGRLTRLGAFYPTPGFCDELMIFYRLEDLAPLTKAVAADADEQIQVHTFTVAEATALLARQQVTDMKTALALALIGVDTA